MGTDPANGVVGRHACIADQIQRQKRARAANAGGAMHGDAAGGTRAVAATSLFLLFNGLEELINVLRGRWREIRNIQVDVRSGPLAGGGGEALAAHEGGNAAIAQRPERFVDRDFVADGVRHAANWPHGRRRTGRQE